MKSANYNPNIHHRHSIRLKGYDYSQAGLYFVTICVQNRECLFGEISNVEPTHSPEMMLNNAGHMIEKWYHELENKFPDIKCHEMIVMPNHFHCIIENVGMVVETPPTTSSTSTPTTVGVDLRVGPNDIKLGERGDEILGEHGGNVKLREYRDDILGKYGNDKLYAHGNDMQFGEQGDDLLGEHGDEILGEHLNEILGEHVGSPLHRVVQWFKTMTTNEYIRGVKSMGWQRFDGKLWQRNYYECIIRNEQSYQRISEYIINNPAKWATDKLYNR